MYVTLGIILLFFVWAFSSFGQKKITTEDEALKRHMQMREQMHQRLRDHLIQGFGNDEDIFKDMEQLFGESMTLDMPSHFKSEWSETSTGRRLVVTPKTPEQKLDISIANGMITIKGGEGRSNFSSSFSVPQDCDASRVKMSQGKGTIIVDLPYLKNEIKKETFRPVAPSKDDVQI